MTDNIEEVRHAREAYAKQFNDDLSAIFAAIKQQQEKGGREFVSSQQSAFPSQVAADRDSR